MEKSFPLIYSDVLAFRWLALNGLYVLLCTLKRNAKMFLAKLGNSKDSHFECRVLFNWLCAPDIGVQLRRIMRHVAFVVQKRGSRRSDREENSSVHYLSEPDFWTVSQNWQPSAE
jgi:hypothetical protein